MLSVLANFDASLANILPIDYFKCMSVHDKELRWDILRPKKVTDKDDAPNQSMSLPQCCALGYLNFEADSQHQMVPTLPCSPNISKCQVSDCH